MVKQDYILNSEDKKKNPPQRIDYWKPEWTLEETDKQTSVIVKPAEEVKKEEALKVKAEEKEVKPVETKDVFKCDFCDYTTEKERGIKTHLRMKHKEDMAREMKGK